MPPVFGGRDDVLAAARVDLAQLRDGRPSARRAIEGLRGTGKTSLMARVRAVAEQAGIVTVHIEADPGGDPVADTTDELRRAATRLLPARGKVRKAISGLTSLSVSPSGLELTWDHDRDQRLIQALVVDAARIAGSVDRGLFITLDEAHEAESTLLKPILKGLHRVDQDRLPGGGWVAGLPGAVSHLIVAGQTYTERITVHDVGLLDRDAVGAAIGPPFAAAAVTVDEMVIDRVATESGGYPFFVQAWGQALWDACATPGRLDAADAARAAPEARRRAEDLMRFRWQRLTEGPRRYAFAMAELGGEGPWHTRDVARRLDRTAHQASPLRATLIDSGAATATGYGLIMFTVPGFGAWLRRTQPRIG